jgi:hypothetical protein
LIESLTEARCYPHSVRGVRVIETHISWVILTGDLAYKIKKPLRFPFLDYRSLEERKRFCEEELRLNRRTAPELYLAVLPITGSAAEPRIGGEGTPIEWALQMRQFDPDALYSQIAELAPLQIDALAGEIFELHARAEIAKPGAHWADPRRAAKPVRACFDQILAQDPGGELRRRLLRLADWCAQEHENRSRLFEERAAGGFVRECHGDLHLGNVAWIAGRARLFDCIEFDPELRWIDVQSELAFSFMDLLHRGRDELAWRLVNAYLERSGDYAGVPLLPYYAVYRALVRAEVAVLRARQLNGGAPAAQEHAELERYVELAERIARRHVPLLVITTGLSGSGKTTVSEGLAQQVGAVRIRSDVERKRMQGLGAGDRSGAAPGAGIYRPDVTRRTYARLAELARAMLAGGQDVIVDATFLARGDRELFAALAQESGARFRIVACSAPLAILRERVAARASAGRDVSDADLAVLEAQHRTREPLARHEWEHAIELRTDLSRAELAAAVREAATALH